MAQLFNPGVGATLLQTPVAHVSETVVTVKAELAQAFRIEQPCFFPTALSRYDGTCSACLVSYWATS